MAPGREGMGRPAEFCVAAGPSLAGLAFCRRSTHPALTRVCKNASFAPLGLRRFPLHPGLTPWAVFLRRFAAGARWFDFFVGLRFNVEVQWLQPKLSLQTQYFREGKEAGYNGRNPTGIIGLACAGRAACAWGLRN